MGVLIKNCTTCTVLILPLELSHCGVFLLSIQGHATDVEATAAGGPAVAGPITAASAPSSSPISVAAAGGHIGVVQLLLKGGGGGRQEIAVAAAQAAARGPHMDVWSLLISHVRRYFPHAVGDCVGDLTARNVAMSLGAAWSADLISLDQQVTEAEQLKTSGQQLLVQIALKYKQMEDLVDTCRAEGTKAALALTAAAASLTAAKAALTAAKAAVSSTSSAAEATEAETATEGCLVLPAMDGHEGTSRGPSSTSSTASTSSRGTATVGRSSSTLEGSGKQGASSGSGCAGSNKAGISGNKSSGSSTASAVSHQGAMVSSVQGHVWL